MITNTLLTLLAVSAAGIQGQQQWQAFEGCWRPIAAETSAAPVPLLCIQETGQGVSVRTYVEGTQRSQRQLVADGSARPVTEGGCAGEETARWSSDGQRVYTRAELTCSGATGMLSSALALLNGETLVEVRSLRVGDNSSVRTLRYRALPATEYPAGFALEAGRELTRETSRLHAAGALTVPDVVEGAQQLDATALDALLAARHAGFDLDAKAVRQLLSAGVARSTLDIMVALTYPDDFRLVEAAAAQPPRPRAMNPAYPRYDPFANYSSQLSFNPYSNCYGLNYFNSYACGYLFGYGYGYPYGYLYGYNTYGWDYTAGAVYVLPVAGRPSQGSGSVSRNGYARGSSSSLGTAQPRNPTAGNTPWRASNLGATSTTGSGASPSGGSTSSGTGSVGGSGYSAGSGSTSTGETAKARGGGE